ncbi:flagellar hook-associated protein 2 [Fredinandcohnia onubensis]|uniref:flagellar hook-associated protein 2 n=1 Tax=Fredinandcohnia onubensis TaxID=1571209 RepID=UPI00211E6F50|nr:flagellar hook-associated protein 2 [Fredinandcohnia onubensis]
MNMRIGGLASGMDIDSIVTDLMKAERIPLNKLNQQKQIYEWQRDQYRDMNKLLAELDTMAFDMTLQRTYQTKTATSSNPSAVTATANTTASNGNYKIEVTQLATAAARSSQLEISGGKKIDPSKSISTQQFATAIDYSAFTIETFNEDGSKNAFTYTPKPEDTLNDILKKITESDIGVRAFYDSTADRVVMERTVTGDFNKDPNYFLGAEIGFSSDTAGFLTNTLQMRLGTQTNGTWESNEVGGDNAIFTYNGVLNVETSKNEYTINDLNLKFNVTTDGPVSISVAQNTEDAFDKIVKFVDKYNEMIEKINGKLSEERYRDYHPLSDEEREAMSDKQAEKWDEMAQSGLLRNDSILSSGLNQMRMDFYTPLSGGIKGFSQLAEFGIKTSSNYMDRGKLLIDNPDKLKQKLQEDPNAVYQLFGADGATYETKGIARRLRDSIKGTITNIESKAGKSTMTNQQFTIGRNLTNIDSQIDRFEDRLIQIEDRYWRQFTAMEKAIQRANQQSAYLMQNFFSG